MYEIEKNIPIPPLAKRGQKQGEKSGHRYPFKAMEIGDSFLVECESIHDMRVRNNIRLSIYNQAVTSRFTVRRVENGLRVWRIK